MASNRIFLDRRTFIGAFGTAFVSSFTAKAQDAFLDNETVVASAFQTGDNKHGLALHTPDGFLISNFPLPSRGHDVVFNPKNDRCVVFARRPGGFGLAVDRAGHQGPTLFHCPQDRHFYGHGGFSNDGRLLFATENDFEHVRGTIGIYDATNRFQRIGEFSSYGVGPHELILDSSGGQLIVANGGIETHPDFGRRKLNIQTMKSSLVYIDIKTGDLLEKHHLEHGANTLSIRHLARGYRDEVLFACQDEGWYPGVSPEDISPLVGRSRIGEGISLFADRPINWSGFKGYIGSIAVSQNREQFAITSPKGNLVAMFNRENLSVESQTSINAVSGLAFHKNQLYVSSAANRFGPLHRILPSTLNSEDIRYENHLAVSNHI